jgi:hypothetical protein
LRARLDNATNPKMQQLYEEKIAHIERWEIPTHKDTITIGMPKNKRPPAQPVPETDFKLDPQVGRITPIHKDEQDEFPTSFNDDADLAVSGGGSAADFLRGIGR